MGILPYLIAATPILVIAAMVATRFALTSRWFNSTKDWTPVPEYQPEKPPALTPLIPYYRRIIKRHLEPEETLEGFGCGFFNPARPTDWKHGPALLIAATSRRILLFELTVLTVHRHRFFPHEAIEYLRPPQPGVFGTSGRFRVGLKNGMEYQMGFKGPLLSEEGMREEQHLAACLRHLAQRFPSERPTYFDSLRRAA